MSNTILEQTRAAHEEMERLERLIVKDMKQEDVKTHREKLMQNHRIRRCLDAMQGRAAKLARIYEDDDGSRKEDLQALSGASMFNTFYDRLKEVRDQHRRLQTMSHILEPEDEEAALKDDPPVEFTGEEGIGRYLDLHALYNRYLNCRLAPARKEVLYVDFCGQFLDFAAVERHKKYSKHYREYLQALLDYLSSFYERTQPLGNLPKQLARVAEGFDAVWDAGQAEGWEDRGEGRATAPQGGAEEQLIDLDAFDTTDALEELGADTLKSALQALGLKCGGTVQQRAARLFQAKGRPLHEVDRLLFSKGAAPPKDEASRQKRVAASRAVALLESQVKKAAELLGSVLQDTQQRVEAKLSMTAEELEADKREQEEEVQQMDSDEEDEYIYNPLNLPMGWDGKPIPFWLYKLHGLNQEFKCEICGNFTYRGRREFEKHFREARHTMGMKSLGIPNSKKFFEVTKCDEAKALWQSIQEKSAGSWKAEVEEEFEDDDGNVYSKKTYDDLRRQGLI